MKGALLCLPCTVRTAYDIAVKATSDKEVQSKLVYETIKWLADDPNVLNDTPAAFHTYVQRLAKKITGNPDPFRELKKASNEIALRAVKVLEKECGRLGFKDSFRLAALGSICGNTIDFEVEEHRFSMNELEASLCACLKGDLAIDGMPNLIKALSKARKVVYLLDNAGEIVFDKFFIGRIIENFPVKVIAVVKEGPILNDATMEDAGQVGLREVAEVITTGNDHIGFDLEESSEELLTHIRTADLVIAKGQGNYESITEVENVFPKPIVYILRAKCSLVADKLGVPRNANIVKVIN
ncbi:DUF89 family protein [Candidatus Bathyarchaeota archaeon]|nr:DUF89 family protein [Candidatus Bathyarchaeota archaeon]